MPEVWNRVKEWGGIFGKTLMFPLLFVLFFFPQGIVAGSDAGDLFVVYLKIAAFFVLAFYYLSLVVRKQVFNYVIGVYGVLYFILFCSGMINNEIYEVMVFFARHALPTMGLMLFMETGIYHDPRRLIEAGAGTLSFLCILNAVLMLFYPEGVSRIAVWGRVNLLESDNSMTCYYFAAFCFVGLRRILYRTKYSWTDMLFFLSYIFAEIFVFCGIGILSFLLFCCLQGYLFCQRKSLSNFGSHGKSPFWMLYILTLAGQLWIMLGSFWAPVLMTLAERIFKKGESFRVRWMIWQGALEQIMESPLLGKGPASIASLYGGIEWYAHNGFLDVLLKAGLVGLVFCLFSHYLVITKLKKAENRMMAVFVYGCIFVLFMIAFLEGPFLQGRYVFVFVIAYRASQITDGPMRSDSAWTDPLTEKLTARLLRKKGKEFHSW